mmetsp:Transcript_28194/g.76425  ORF Transcript_28194/g.76425 Transcript_28194/m.76425 type:complete len:234 (+) Transcript_28194:433-1134(+)
MGGACFLWCFLFLRNGFSAVPKGQPAAVSVKRIDFLGCRPPVNGEGYDTGPVDLSGPIDVLEEGLFSRSRGISRHKGHQALAGLFSFRVLCFGVVLAFALLAKPAGSAVACVLLFVPNHEQVVAGLEQWPKDVQQTHVGIRTGHSSLHDFQIARNLPFLYLGNAAVVGDGLWVEHFQKVWIKDFVVQVVLGDDAFQDQVAEFLKLVPQHLFRYFLREALARTSQDAIRARRLR